MKRTMLLCAFLLFSCGKSPENNTNIVQAAPPTLQSFLPENDLDQFDNFFADTGLNESEFNAVLERARKVYAPIVKKLGGNLVVKSDYRSPTVNAYAVPNGRNWEVFFHGGLARRPEITEAGFALVVCHEIGHHLAGYPFVPNAGWPASSEGNSDFFSTAACARKLFEPDWGTPAEDESMIDYAECDIFDDEIAHDVCQRSMEGGQSLANLLAALGGKGVPSYSTPDPKVVRSTYYMHNAAQCRLDTFKAGTLCLKSWNENRIPKTFQEMQKNSCGERPRCWFRS